MGGLWREGDKEGSGTKVLQGRSRVVRLPLLGPGPVCPSNPRTRVYWGGEGGSWGGVDIIRRTEPSTGGTYTPTGTSVTTRYRSETSSRLTRTYRTSTTRRLYPPPYRGPSSAPIPHGRLVFCWTRCLYRSPDRFWSRRVRVVCRFSCPLHGQACVLGRGGSETSVGLPSRRPLRPPREPTETDLDGPGRRFRSRVHEEEVSGRHSGETMKVAENRSDYVNTGDGVCRGSPVLRTRGCLGDVRPPRLGGRVTYLLTYSLLTSVVWSGVGLGVCRRGGEDLPFRMAFDPPLRRARAHPRQVRLPTPLTVRPSPSLGPPLAVSPPAGRPLAPDDLDSFPVLRSTSATRREVTNRGNRPYWLLKEEWVLPRTSGPDLRGGPMSTGTGFHRRRWKSFSRSPALFTARVATTSVREQANTSRGLSVRVRSKQLLGPSRPRESGRWTRTGDGQSSVLVCRNAVTHNPTVGDGSRQRDEK